jgi:hypothetical protein
MKFLRKTDDFKFYPYVRGHHARVKNPMTNPKGSLNLTHTPTPEWVETKDLCVGDFLSYPTVGTVVEDPNSSIEKARLLGYFAAEGSYIKEPVFDGVESDYAVKCLECGHLFNHLGNHVQVHGISWKEYLAKYPGSVIKAKKSIDLVRGGRKASHTDIGLTRSFRTVGLEFSLGKHEYTTLNKEIADLAKVAFPGCTVLRYDDIVKVLGQVPVAYMQEYCGEYSDRKQLSPKVIQWPVDLQKHVIATWFIGDYACTVSKHMSDQFRVLLNRCEVRFNTYKTNAKDYVTIAKGKTYSGKKRESYLHQINTLGMEILAPYLKYAFEFKNKKLKPVYHGSKNYASYDKGYMLRQIKTIDKLEFEGLVYNFEVEGDNSYIANDVAVHNCLIQYSFCSKCGQKAKDEAEQCEHVRFYRRNNFYDPTGKKRIIGEICGHKDDPSSVQFIDASWVRKPAFPGAVLRNIVSPPESIPAEVLNAVANAKQDPLLASIKDRSVITTEHHAIQGLSKAASLRVAEDAPADEAARFPGTGKEEDPAPEEDAPPADDAAPGPLDAPPVDDPAAAPPIDDPSATPPADSAPGTTPDEAQSTPLAKIKNEVLDNVLTQVKQQLIDQVKSTFNVDQTSPSDQVAKNDEVYNNALSSNDSIVKNASSRETAKYLSNKYSIDITSIRNVKLAATLMATASLNSFKEMNRLGFSRRDAAEALYFVDHRVNGPGVSPSVVEYVARNKMASEKDFLLGYMVSTVKRPSQRESVVLVQWSKMLGNMK